jgi:predicted nucleotidyltransferase
MNSTIETKALQVIKEEIEKRGLKILKVILFGSRAKGEAKEDSDRDFNYC